VSDPLARRLGAAALAVALLALVLAVRSAWQAEHELRELRVAVERAVRGQQGPPGLGPRPTLDADD
jgi:hypothetical protein